MNNDTKFTSFTEETASPLWLFFSAIAIAVILSITYGTGYTYGRQDAINALSNACDPYLPNDPRMQ